MGQPTYSKINQPNEEVVFKKKNQRHSFSFTMFDRSFSATFISYDDKVIKCILKDFDAQREYIGKAECNFVAGDMFDEREGMEIAFLRASKRLWADIKKESKYLEKLSTQIIQAFEGFEEKFDIFFDKGVLDTKKTYSKKFQERNK